MSDEADIAGEICAAWLEGTLARRRRLAEIEAGRPVNKVGDCEDCGLPIDPRRLALDPRAQRCVSCQAESERR